MKKFILEWALTTAAYADLRRWSAQMLLPEVSSDLFEIHERLRAMLAARETFVRFTALETKAGTPLAYELLDGDLVVPTISPEAYRAIQVAFEYLDNDPMQTVDAVQAELAQQYGYPEEGAPAFVEEALLFLHGCTMADLDNEFNLYE